MNELPTLDITTGLEHIAWLDRLLRESDTTGAVDRLLEDENRAEQAFQQYAYADTSVWSLRPRHPFAGGLLAYCRRGQYDRFSELTPPVIELAQKAYVIRQFEADWKGYERWLVARLLDRSDCDQAVFEFEVAHHLRLAGHDVEYRSAKQPKGPDLLLREGEGIEVECTLISTESGRSVPPRSAELVQRRLLREMRRDGTNRVVLVTCREGLRGADREALHRSIIPLVKGGAVGSFAVLGGRYAVEIVFGGSRDAPLRHDELQQLLRGLDKFPNRRGDIRPLSAIVATPRLRLARIVGVRSDAPDTATGHLVEAAARKSRQVSGTRPAIVAVGFGALVSYQQVQHPKVQLGLQALADKALRDHRTVSALMLVFRSEWRQDLVPLGGGPGVRVHQQQGVVYGFRSDHRDAKPLPQHFQFSLQRL